MNAAKYIIIDGCAIVFSAALAHSDIAHGRKVESAGFVSFYTRENGYGDQVILAQVYGESTSLKIKSREEDAMIIARQITSTY